MKIKSLNFWQRNNFRMFCLTSFSLVLLFIGSYTIIPKNEYFDFIIYSLSILNAFIFMIIEIIRTFIEDSIQKVYTKLKSDYVIAKEIYVLQSYFVHRLDELFSQNMKDEKFLSELNLIVKRNLRCLLFDNKEHIDSARQGLEIIEFSNIFIKLENYIINSRWEKNNFKTKILAYVYFIWQKANLREIEKFIMLIEKSFGDKLFEDINNEHLENQFKNRILIILEDLDYEIDNYYEKLSKENIDYFQDVTKTLDEIKSQIDFLDDEIQDVMWKLYNIERYFDREKP